MRQSREKDREGSGSGESQMAVRKCKIGKALRRI